MLRVGRGLGLAIFCEDIDGWDRAIFVLEDVTRATGLFAALAGPFAGKSGGPVKEGIYEFQTPGGIPYVGQSGNIPARIAKHESSGLKPPGTAYKSKSVPGGVTMREIAEHQRIQEITGGVPARKSPRVANKKDPIGPKRRNLLDE